MNKRYQIPVEHNGERKVMMVGERLHRDLQKIVEEHYRHTSDAFFNSDIVLSIKPVEHETAVRFSVAKNRPPVRGFKTVMNEGFVCAPYNPVIKDVDLTSDPVNVKGVMTRYAKKTVNPDFYGTVTVTDTKRFTASLAEEIVSVQPMTAPAGQIFYMDYGYESKSTPAPAVIADPATYPHVCPRCSAPAYIGLMKVDCSRKSCA